MIDIRKLKELVRLMVENDLSELDLRDQEEKVTVKRGPSGVPMVQQYAMPAPAAIAPAASNDGGAPAASAKSDDGLIAIESPMVGTYYSAPNPDSPAYVSVGGEISDDSVVCLIEAMKVFNEIKAECSGTIERMLVKNGESVEFGQTLFLVRPN